MTSSRGREHVREGDGFLGVPGGSGKEEVFSHTELIDEPDHHEAIAPVGHERSASDRFLATTLRVCSAAQTLGLPIGDLDTPAVAESLDGLLIGSRRVGVEENRVRVLSAGISDHHDGQRFIPGSLVPDCLEPVHRHDGLLAVEADPSPFPKAFAVGEDRFWARQTVSLFPWTPSFACGVQRRHSVQGSVHADLSGDMHPPGAILEQLFVRVSAIHDDPEGYGGIMPRASQSNQPCAQLGLALVFLAHWLHLRLFRPPQTSGLGQQNTRSDMPGKRTTTPMMTKQTPYPIGLPVLGASPSC